MRTFITLTIATGLLATAAAADSPENCAAAWWWQKAGKTYGGVMTQTDFMEMCLADNYQVTAAWSTSVPPANATGKCKDGTWTTTTYQGACAGHGGVDSWLPGH